MLNGLENLCDRCSPNRSVMSGLAGFGKLSDPIVTSLNGLPVDGTLRFLSTTFAKQNFRNYLAIASVTSVIGTFRT